MGAASPAARPTHARICVIDRSETVLPGSSPDTEAESVIGNGVVPEEATVRQDRLAGSTVTGSRLDQAIWRGADVLRRHWLLALLIAGGLVLRVVTQFAYEPALLFIDSKKYLSGTDFNLGALGSFDPIGYTLLMLKPVLMFGNLGLVALLQHVLGLGMAVALYVLMLRRGVIRWLAALAVAPVLLDAYQLNAEQTIMPDVLFEALVVAGIVLLLWQPRPGLPFVILAGLAFGTSAPVRQVGEALTCRAVYVVAAARDWRTRLLHGAVLFVCFALPIVGYMGYSKVVLHYGFEMSNMGDAYLYGRTAHAADCATLKLPPDEQLLLPHPGAGAQVRRGRTGQQRRLAAGGVRDRRPAWRGGLQPPATAPVRLRGDQAAADAGGRRHHPRLDQDLRPDPEHRGG